MEEYAHKTQMSSFAAKTNKNFSANQRAQLQTKKSEIKQWSLIVVHKFQRICLRVTKVTEWTPNVRRG